MSLRTKPVIWLFGPIINQRQTISRRFLSIMQCINTACSPRQLCMEPMFKHDSRGIEERPSFVKVNPARPLLLPMIPRLEDGGI